MGDSKNKEVMTRSYLINFYDNKHTLCLKANECYKWVLSDDDNDGMCSGKCGSYSFDLNGSEILSGNGKFEGKRPEEFCTGGGGSNPASTPTSAPTSISSTSSTTSTTQFCDDDENFEFRGDESKTCADWVATGDRDNIQRKCRRKSKGSKVMFWCPKNMRPARARLLRLFGIKRRCPMATKRTGLRLQRIRAIKDQGRVQGTNQEKLANR